MKGCSSEKWQFSGSPPQISGADVLPPPPSFLPPPSLFKTVHFDAGSMEEEEEAGSEQFIPVEVIPHISHIFHIPHIPHIFHISHIFHIPYLMTTLKKHKHSHD